MRNVTEERIFRISLGMLISMGGGLVAIVAAFVALEIKTEATAKDLSATDAKAEITVAAVAEMNTRLAVLQEDVSFIRHSIERKGRR